MMFELPPSTTELQFDNMIGMRVKTTSSFISEVSNVPHKTSEFVYTTADQSVLGKQRETTTAWILFATMSILFCGSLTINVIVLAFLVYKKRQVGGEKVQRSEFKIEDNPCYEATEMKQNNESEAHVYETVRVKRAK